MTNHDTARALRDAADDIRHYATHGLFSPAEKTGMTLAAEVVEHHASELEVPPSPTDTPALATDGKPRVRLIRYPSTHDRHPRIWAAELPAGWHAAGWFPDEGHHRTTGRYAYPFSRSLTATYENIAADYFRKDIQEGHHS